MANYALAAVRKGQIAVQGKKRIEFDLNRPCNQPTSAGSQNFGERIIDFVFLSERDDAILVHGVTLLLGDLGGLVTNPVTPPSSPRHPVSRIALTEPANHRLRFIRAFLLIVGVYLRSQASSSVQNFAHPRRETRRFERLFKESKRRRFRLGIDESRH